MSHAIVHFASNHDALDIRIFVKQARTLAREGYDVTVVAPHERDEIIDGVRILAVPRPVSRRQRMTRTAREVYGRARALDADTYHFHDIEMIPWALLLKLQGKHVIYDVHEDRPKQMLSKTWIAPRLRPLVSAATRFADRVSGHLFDRIIAVTPSIAASFPERKTFVIQNYPIEEELVPADDVPYGERPNLAIFVGGISAIRGIHEMIDAIDGVPSDLEARLLLVGAFSDGGVEAAAKAQTGWRHVDALGWQARPELARHLAQARVGLVLYLPEPNHIAAQPNKLFEYMSAGLPVIASDFPLWRDIIVGSSCGLVVDPTDPTAIAGAIAWVLEHPEEAALMGRSGRAAVRDRFNWHSESRRLVDVYAGLAA